jgi:hypothetical protein
MGNKCAWMLEGESWDIGRLCNGDWGLGIGDWGLGIGYRPHQTAPTVPSILPSYLP